MQSQSELGYDAGYEDGYLRGRQELCDQLGFTDRRTLAAEVKRLREAEKTYKAVMSHLQYDDARRVWWVDPRVIDFYGASKDVGTSLD